IISRGYSPAFLTRSRYKLLSNFYFYCAHCCLLLISVISFDPQKYKGMMEKIKLSEVERGLPNGIIAQIRGLNTQGEGILEPLDSFLSDILCARGSFIYN